MVLPGAAMTVAIVRPPWWRSTTCSAGPWCVAAIVAILVAADARRARRLERSCSTTSWSSRRSSPSCWWSPMRSTGRSGCDSRRASSAGWLGERGQPVRRRRRSRLDPRERRRGPASSWPPSPEPWRPRSASGTSASRSTGAAGNGWSPPTGSGRPAVRTLPITYRDARSAGWCCRRAGVRSRLSRRDEQLLGDLVRQAATAARTSQLAEELQASRERLVTAREEERRRIRRDLHDGLGPSLSGVVFQLESARLLVDTGPRGREAAARRDERAGAGRRRRRTPPRARPATARARRPRPRRRAPAAGGAAPTPDLAIAVDAADLDSAAGGGRGGGATGSSGEALTNVAPARPAPRAPRVTWIADGALVVEVADDGVGIPDEASGRGRPGVAARAGCRARRPRRDHVPGRRRHHRQGLAAPATRRKGTP